MTDTLITSYPATIRAIDSLNVASSYAGVVGDTIDIVDTSMLASQITVTVSCPAATTATVEYSTTPGAASDPDNAIWQFWPDGTVGASTTITDVFNGRLAALRFTRATGVDDVVYEVLA